MEVYQFLSPNFLQWTYNHALMENFEHHSQNDLSSTTSFDNRLLVYHPRDVGHFSFLFLIAL